MPPDGPVLGVDTTGDSCSAALVQGAKTIARRDEPRKRGQAERLFPMLSDLLRESGSGWRDLRAIGVVTGPGNFTGIRLGIAAARGLSLSLSIPAVGVSAFEAAALDIGKPCCVMIASRGERVYAMVLPSGEPVCEAAGDLPRPDAGTLVVGGPAARTAAAAWGREWREPVFTNSEAAARIAETANPPRTGRPVPFYIRTANAAPRA